MATDRYATQAGGGGAPNNGQTWATAFTPAELYADVLANAAADWHYWLFGDGDETYALAGAHDASAIDGTAALPIRITGVDSASNEPPLVSEYATGANRPLITAGANEWRLGDFWTVQNLRGTISHTGGFRHQNYCTLNNCQFQQTSGVNDDKCVWFGNYGQVVNSELYGAGSRAFYGSFGNRLYRNYIHDCRYAIFMLNLGNTVADNVVDSATIAGIYGDGTQYNTIIGNTIYNCPYGIFGPAASDGWTIMHNLIDTCTTKGIDFTNAYLNHFLDYNNYNGNSGGDVDDITKGPNATAHDPQFVDAAGGDFRLMPSSPCLRAGMPFNLAGGSGQEQPQGAIWTPDRHQAAPGLFRGAV